MMLIVSSIDDDAKLREKVDEALAVYEDFLKSSMGGEASVNGADPNEALPGENTGLGEGEVGTA